ncbi:hypothetical protein HPP92_011568 [Vanilla planifolia]|uniref:RING-type E3 ubiquitin transferase n=1 Tax=Vanilla planifolia TaxID=51239 RepID=A0A835R320_VANPL|nr:hypothetical protein HPP92_011568 [Vanilla planifolia]
MTARYRDSMPNGGYENVSSFLHPLGSDRGSRIVALVVIVVVVIILFILSLSLLLKSCCLLHRRQRRQAIDFYGQSSFSSFDERGVDSAVLESLSVLVFSSTEPAACAVCLMEFEDGERFRSLPKCRHRFHVQCVDTWLQSHATCPLCRVTVQVNPPAEAANSSSVEDGARNLGNGSECEGLGLR